MSPFRSLWGGIDDIDGVHIGNHFERFNWDHAKVILAAGLLDIGAQRPDPLKSGDRAQQRN